jgi:hypothetical protein
MKIIGLVVEGNLNGMAEGFLTCGTNGFTFFESLITQKTDRRIDKVQKGMEDFVEWIE